MDKEEIMKFWVDVWMGISFLLVTITGIFKWQGLTPQILSRTANPENFYLLSRIHDWSGIIMALLVLVHLVLNRVWIKSMISCMFKKQEKCDIENGGKGTKK